MQLQDTLELAVALVFLGWLFFALKGTRTLQMLSGLLFLAGVLFALSLAGLTGVNWVVAGLAAQGLLVMVILFQPEIRRFLAQIGQNPLRPNLSASEESRTIEELIRSVVSLANKKLGAILVLERKNELVEIIEMGVTLDAKISRELLLSLFTQTSPLHDGAVILRGDRLVAAGCFLPLTLGPGVSKMLGTRHRAAVGVTEESDAVVVVVSEETGAVSVAVEGKLTRDIDPTDLRELLAAIFLKDFREDTPVIQRLREIFPTRDK